jgi:hypothetical protein
MRIPKTWVPVLAKEVMEELLRKESIELNAPQEQVMSIIEELILGEIMVEDRLNDEVREILKKFDSEIEQGRLDYRRLFDMTKHKLIKERDIIL